MDPHMSLRKPRAAMGRRQTGSAGNILPWSERLCLGLSLQRQWSSYLILFQFILCLPHSCGLQSRGMVPSPSYTLFHLVHMETFASALLSFPDKQLFESALWNLGKVKEAECSLFPMNSIWGTQKGSVPGRAPQGPAPFHVHPGTCLAAEWKSLSRWFWWWAKLCIHRCGSDSQFYLWTDWWNTAC